MSNPIELVAKALNAAVTNSDPSNVETNRKVWDRYSQQWSPDEEWVQKMVQNLGMDGKEHLKFVGSEWSDNESLEQVLSDFLIPYVQSEFTVAEIGVGGGRIAYHVAPLVNKLHCYDISNGMLKRAREALTAYSNVTFTLLGDQCRMPTEDQVYDFVYSFDVLPHCDMHVIYQYLKEIGRVLKPKGTAFLHTANILAPDGWARFEKQTKSTVAGFQFISPDIVSFMVQKAGLTTIKHSTPHPSNIYYNRDYLFIIQKP